MIVVTDGVHILFHFNIVLLAQLNVLYQVHALEFLIMFKLGYLHVWTLSAIRTRGLCV